MPLRQGLGTGRMQKISGSGMQAYPLPHVGLFTLVEVLQGRRVGWMGRPGVDVVEGAFEAVSLVLWKGIVGIGVIRFVGERRLELLWRR